MIHSSLQILLKISWRIHCARILFLSLYFIELLHPVHSIILVKFSFSGFSIVYSPRSDALEQVMSVFGIVFGDVIQMEDSSALNQYFQLNSTNMTFAGIEFDDSYKGLTNLSKVNDLKVSIR